MKERPILFNGDMVRAILDGRKTQTRRLNDLSGINKNPDAWDTVGFSARSEAIFRNHSTGDEVFIPAPYFSHQTIWVRETFAFVSMFDQLAPSDLNSNAFVQYRAGHCDSLPLVGRWRPSIHMPRWASRIDLIATHIRVERAQDITAEDARKEGHPKNPNFYSQEVHDDAARDWFMDLWDEINESRGYGWRSNPWVWVIDFEVLRK